MNAATRWAVGALLALVVVPALGGFWASVATLGVVYALCGVSLVVLVGWSGQLNLHVAALGLGWGAYAAFALSALGLAPVWAIAGAAALTVPFSLVVGAVAVRFRGLELAVATLAIGLTFERLVFRNLGEWLARASDLATPFESSFVTFNRPRVFGSSLIGDRVFYLFALGVAAGVVWVAGNAARSSLRRALVAIREREVPAEVAGLPTIRYRTAAFVASIAVAGVAGALFASLKLGIAPESFSLDVSFMLLAGVVIGGTRSIWGGVLGGALAAVLPEVVRPGAFGDVPNPLVIFGGERLLLVFAVGMVLVLRLRPQGLIGPRSAVVRPAAATVAVPERVRAPRETVLRTQDVAVNFGGVQALAGVDLRLTRGQICALIGPNGAGKSTLFNVLSGVIVPDRGRVYLRGDDVTAMPPHRRTALGLGRTFQSVEVFGSLSVVENVMIGAHASRTASVGAELFGLPSARRSEAVLADRAMDTLRRLGLEAHAHRRPDELSFGHLRRLEVATALVARPGVLLLDEPSAGLNPSESVEIAELIASLRDELALAVLLVEHDMSVVGRIAEWVYVLDFGEVIASGTPDRVRDDELVIARYLGEAQRV